LTLVLIVKGVKQSMASIITVIYPADAPRQMSIQYNKAEEFEWLSEF